MIALIDCNNFFCSVEKVFYPGLKNKAVLTLSSNDGYIIALTHEAKKIGFRRGEPIFKKRELLEHNDVKVFSGNMYLYAAMSQRINNILRSYFPRIDRYSIDESMIYLDGYEKYYNIEEYMRDVVNKIKLYTDIPTSVGIAPSKTLAKMGSKFAKQYTGYRSVCMIDNDEKRRKALSLFSLEDVWGIGKSTLEKLNYYGIHTPLDFADKKESWIRSHFHLPLIQTWKELNGIPCIDTSEIIQKQTICTSRSFGNMVQDIDSIKASVAEFAASSANKLRGQNSVASSVTVFITSNVFREDLPQYSNTHTILLPIPTSDTIEITKAAMKIVDQIYRPGISYKRSGVILDKISDATIIEPDLFDNIRNRTERLQLMKTIDRLNHKYGLKKIRLAVEGTGKQAWHVKSEHRSGNYLSDINEILTIKI